MAWEIDAAHSSARFLVRRMTSATVRAQRAAVRGYLCVDEDTPAHTWMDVQVDVAMIYDAAGAPDSRVPSPASRRPPRCPTPETVTLTFKSMVVERISGSRCDVRGELTILGTTRLVTFHAEIHQRDSHGRAHPVVLSAWARINSSAFAIPLGALAEPERVCGGETFRLELGLAVDSHTAPGAKAEIGPEATSKRGLLQAA